VGQPRLAQNAGLLGFLAKRLGEAQTVAGIFRIGRHGLLCQFQRRLVVAPRQLYKRHHPEGFRIVGMFPIERFRNCADSFVVAAIHQRLW
jgi:hypothetical protein